jgi:hypothetical protein
VAATLVTSGVKPDSTALMRGDGYRYGTVKGLEIDVTCDRESHGDFTANTAGVKFRLPF